MHPGKWTQTIDGKYFKHEVLSVESAVWYGTGLIWGCYANKNTELKLPIAFLPSKILIFYFLR
jgi:hypothetical protein